MQENLEGLSEGQRGQFLSLVTEYQYIFAKNTSDLGKSDLLEHEIYTGDCQPIKQPHSAYQRKVIDHHLDDLLFWLLVELNSDRAHGKA